ncbi:hypothetical protein ON010_g3803 [Phytophthora cinnamomi]|nr:hypothetical protein ON010_g3803 [Phytophthora cinnamomi]
MMKCIFTAALVCAILYGAIGCAAFDLYGDVIDGNILLNLQSDPVMKIPLVATYHLVFDRAVHVPVVLSPAALTYRRDDGADIRSKAFT